MTGYHATELACVQAKIAFDFGAFFSKGLRMGTGQADVKRYNR